MSFTEQPDQATRDRSIDRCFYLGPGLFPAGLLKRDLDDAAHAFFVDSCEGVEVEKALTNGLIGSKGASKNQGSVVRLVDRPERKRGKKIKAKKHNQETKKNIPRTGKTPLEKKRKKEDELESIDGWAITPHRTRRKMHRKQSAPRMHKTAWTEKRARLVPAHERGGFMGPVLSATFSRDSTRHFQRGRRRLATHHPCTPPWSLSKRFTPKRRGKGKTTVPLDTLVVCPGKDSSARDEGREDARSGRERPYVRILPPSGSGR